MALDVDDVLAKTDIASLIGEVVELQPRNARSAELVGLCPFHEDSHPSFEVNAAKGIYSCWSCSAGLNNKRGGNALVFVQKYYGLSFVEALTFLAKRAGINVPDRLFHKTSAKVLQALQQSTNAAALVDRAKRNPSTVSQKASGQAADAPSLRANKSVLYDVLKTAQDFYRAALMAHPKALDYLCQTRGIPLKVLQKYDIGYAPEAFTNINVAYSQDWLGKHPRALINAGLSKVSSKGRQYDFFRDRIMFPIKDAQSKTCGFGARRLSDANVFDPNGHAIKIPKYLNSPATAVFDKSDLLFGLVEARSAIARAGHALLVEGYMDVLGLASHGIENAVAVMGVALSGQNIERLLSVTRHLVICMDPDAAGIAAARRVLDSLAAHLSSNTNPTGKSLHVRFVHLPPLDGISGKKADPDEFIRMHGKHAFEQLISSSSTVEQFLRKVWESDLAQQPGNKIHLAREATHLVTAVKDVALKQSLSKISESCFGPQTLLTPKQAVQTTAHHSATSNSATGQSSAKAPSIHEPSERLRHSCMTLPYEAQIVRPSLVSLQQSVDHLAESDAILWMARFDQAVSAGLAMQKQGGSASVSTLTEVELASHLRVVKAAPSVFSHYLNQISREQLAQQLSVGQIDGHEYLAQIERKRIYPADS